MAILTFIFTFHFHRCFKLRSEFNSPHHSWRPPPPSLLPPLPLSHLYHHYHSIYTVTTTSTPTLTRKCCKRPDAMQTQTMAIGL
jgi:hypothetical protein